VILFVFVVEAGGMVFGLQVRQWIHKVSIAVIMDSGERPAEILTMRMKISFFDQVKIHEREFKLGDEMYDVVWRETENDEYIIYCFRDAAEEKMAAKFLRFLANGTNDNENTATQVMQSMLIGFFLTVPEHGYTAAPLPEREQFPLFTSYSLYSRGRCVELPPPRSNFF
jgi:hypothetical protein